MPKDGKADTVQGVRAPYRRILLNFPPELAAQVKELAEREGRSLTRQVQRLVEQALGNA